MNTDNYLALFKIAVLLLFVIASSLVYIAFKLAMVPTLKDALDCRANTSCFRTVVEKAPIVIMRQ